MQAVVNEGYVSPELVCLVAPYARLDLTMITAALQ